MSENMAVEKEVQERVEDNPLQKDFKNVTVTYMGNQCTLQSLNEGTPVIKIRLRDNPQGSLMDYFINRADLYQSVISLYDGANLSILTELTTFKEKEGLDLEVCLDSTTGKYYPVSKCSLQIYMLLLAMIISNISESYENYKQEMKVMQSFLPSIQLKGAPLQ